MIIIPYLILTERSRKPLQSGVSKDLVHLLDSK